MKEFLAESEKDVYYHGEDMFSELLAWAEKAREWLETLVDFHDLDCICLSGDDYRALKALLAELPEEA